MKIEKIKLFKEFHPGHERKKDTDTISLHGSAGGENASTLFKWWRSLPELTDQWSIKKLKNLKNGIGFYHYIIDLDGKIFNTHNINRWFYHAHSGFADSTTIAVCLVNNKTGNLGEYTFEQYLALNQLIDNLILKVGTLEKIDTHSYRSMRYSAIEAPTPCPGPNFNRDELWDTGLDFMV